jgi:eukaryotic-like serine/threonine-protein kinase
MRQAAPIARALGLPDRYRVVRRLAGGGMATVWEAEDRLLGRRVAVKVLAEHLAEDVGARERFQREARAAAKVSDHPNVVTIYDVGEADGRPFIVMELLRGGTVAQHLRERRPGRAEALSWLSQAAQAIDDAHDRGLVHRDIKPGNLLLDGRGRLAVADFGIARLAHDQTVTTTGQVLGTAAYLAPEQARGEPATPASDRYALAVVAFELLTGRRPFTAEHFAAQARQHIDDAPPPASAVRPELPAAVDAALGRGLAKEPRGRWPTASGMVRALEAALPNARAATIRTRAVPRPAPPPPVPARRSRTEGAPPQDRPPAGDARAIGDGPPTSPNVPPVAAFPAPRHRRGRVRLAAALALLAVVAVVGAIASSSGGERRITARVDQATKQRAQDAASARRAARQRRARAKSTSTKASNRRAAAPSGDPATLNAQGFALMNAGRYREAVPILQKAVNACGGSPARLTCAYAMFNLGKSLRLAGRPTDAIPWLQRRLQNPDQRPAVERELAAARAAASGGDSSSGGSSQPTSGATGKAKGHEKAKGGTGKGD